MAKRDESLEYFCSVVWSGFGGMEGVIWDFFFPISFGEFWLGFFFLALKKNFENSEFLKISSFM